MNFRNFFKYISLISAAFIFMTASQAGIPLWSFTPDPAFPPRQVIPFTDTTTVQYVVTSNTNKAHTLVIKPITGVSQASPCYLAPKGSCVLTLVFDGTKIGTGVVGGPSLCQANPNGSPNPNLCYQPSAADSLNILTTQDFATLNSSTSLLALSVNDPGTNAALTGTPRKITLTNSGTQPARNLTISYPTWPNGTTASSDCGSALAAGASCTITITPGQDSTSTCTSGIAPTPGEIEITSSDTSALTVGAVVLSYQCLYQGGYVFSVDDTTPDTTSISGKVVTTFDQAAALPNGILWSSNGQTSGASLSLDSIPYTDQLGGPTYAAAKIIFDSTYSNTNIYPFPAQSSFLTCDGKTNGACNSANILNLYNTYITNYDNGFMLTPGPTNPNLYAIGLCTQTISDYSDWYLPAVCEMGFSAAFCNNAGVPIIQNIRSNIPTLATGFYWSSTQSATNYQEAYIVSLSAGGQFATTKAAAAGVRCVRVLTP